MIVGMYAILLGFCGTFIYWCRRARDAKSGIERNSRIVGAAAALPVAVAMVVFVTWSWMQSAPHGGVWVRLTLYWLSFTLSSFTLLSGSLLAGWTSLYLRQRGHSQTQLPRS